MKPDIKAQWLEALRSGKYKQGRGMLYREGKYCVIGVLKFAVAANSVDNVLHGLYGRNNLAEVECITILNDVTRLTFPQLADIIERFVETEDANVATTPR